MTQRFVTPTTRPVAAGRDVFWSHFQQTRSTSILKNGTTYTEVDGPSDEEIEAADVTYLGGHVYHITDAEAALLTAAGYGEGLTVIGPFTGYGIGPFGAGLYGEGATGPPPGGSYGSGPFGDGPFS